MSHWILIGCCISHLPGSKCSCRLHFLEAIMQLCGQWCQTSASALKKCGHLTIQNTVMLCCCRSADNNAQVTSKRRVIQVATATVRPVVRYQCSQKIIWLFSISICRYLVAAEVLTIMLEVTSKSRVAAQVLSLADVHRWIQQCPPADSLGQGLTDDIGVEEGSLVLWQCEGKAGKNLQW